MNRATPDEAAQPLNSETTKNYFTLVNDAILLLPVLKKRLPITSNIYNMAIFSNKFKDVLQFYVLGEHDNRDEETWVITASYREDYGMEYHISTKLGAQVTPEIRKAFTDSKFFNWDNDFRFVVFDPTISLMLLEISIHRGNSTNITPRNLYFSPGSIENSIDKLNDGVEFKSLNTTEGIEFLCSNWKYCVNGTQSYVRQVVGELPSVGCIVQGKLVSGILTYGNGTMGMLYTDKYHRNKNYGKICMQMLCKELDMKGYMPCSMVDVKNIGSNIFHQKIGMTQAEHRVYSVFYRRFEF